MKSKTSLENRISNKDIKVVNINTIRKEINATDIWPCEEHNFTPWLKDNIDQLNEVLGLNLEVISIEQQAGRYELDVYCKDLDTNNTFAIENQFGTSDNTHVGKSTIYASILKAKGVIWIGEKMLPEHITYFEWLNSITPEDYSFYGVELKSYNINGVNAFEFNVIVEPDKDTKKINKIINNTESSNFNLRYEFFNKIQSLNLDDYLYCNDLRNYGTFFNKDFYKRHHFDLGIFINRNIVYVTIVNKGREYEQQIDEFLKNKGEFDKFERFIGTKSNNYMKWRIGFSYNESPIEVFDEVMKIYEKYNSMFDEFQS